MVDKKISYIMGSVSARPLSSQETGSNVVGTESSEKNKNIMSISQEEWFENRLQEQSKSLQEKTSFSEDFRIEDKPLLESLPIKLSTKAEVGMTPSWDNSYAYMGININSNMPLGIKQDNGIFLRGTQSGLGVMFEDKNNLKWCQDENSSLGIELRMRSIFGCGSNSLELKGSPLKYSANINEKVEFYTNPIYVRWKHDFDKNLGGVSFGSIIGAGYKLSDKQSLYVEGEYDTVFQSGSSSHQFRNLRNGATINFGWCFKW